MCGLSFLLVWASLDKNRSCLSLWWLAPTPTNWGVQEKVILLYTHFRWNGYDECHSLYFFSHSFHGLQFSFRQWMWRRLHVMCTTSACCFLVIVTWSNAKNHFSFSPTFRKKKKLIPFAWPSGQNSNYLGPICIASQFPPMSFWFPTV